MSYKTTVWVPERVARLRKLWADKRYSTEDIAKALGLSFDAVSSKAHKLKLAHRPKGAGRNGISKQAITHIEIRERAERVRNITACTMHLVDLKRAGFKARHGELVIGSKDRPARLSTPYAPVFSPFGSMAALCTE